MKGFIKSVFGIGLTMATTTAFLVGTSFILSNKSYSYEDKKKYFLENYQLTQEYQEDINEAKVKNNNALGNGEISQTEYESNIESLKDVENVIVNYGGAEVNQELTVINSKIQEQDKKETAGYIMSTVSCAFCIPAYFIGMKLCNSADNIKLAKNGKDDYMDREVII